MARNKREIKREVKGIQDKGKSYRLKVNRLVMIQEIEDVIPWSQVLKETGMHGIKSTHVQGVAAEQPIQRQG